MACGSWRRSILIKNSLALLTMLVLAGTTPFHKLLAALRKLGVPPVLVATLQFMDRYRHVLMDELDRMTTARRARTFRPPRFTGLELAHRLDRPAVSADISNAPSGFTAPWSRGVGTVSSAVSTTEADQDR